MNDDMLDGLNSLVNMADKPAGGKPAGNKLAQPPKPDNNPSTAFPAEDSALSQQILVRLDGIRDAIDALPRPVPSTEKSLATPSPAPVERPRVPPRPTPTIQTQPPRAAPVVVWWPYIILVSAALELVAFALGMGYGAIVASGKFPFWYRPGVAGVLIDWVAAPAGVLLLPVMAGLLALGGAELQREGREKAAKTVWAVAGGAAVIALLVPFIA